MARDQAAERGSGGSMTAPRITFVEGPHLDARVIRLSVVIVSHPDGTYSADTNAVIGLDEPQRASTGARFQTRTDAAVEATRAVFRLLFKD